MIRNFILIIGAMKSGTTTLYDYLAQHPQIAIGREKEPGFFGFEEKWALGLDWYKSQFEFNWDQHLYALDASTDYTKYPFCKDVIDRLAASAPRRFKLIYIMRNPLRRIRSHARHVAREKCEIGRCPSPRDVHSLDAGISPVSIAISRYAYQIDQYAKYFGDGDLLLLTLEQLAADHQSVLERIFRFLHIDSLQIGPTPLKSNEAEPSSMASDIHHTVYSFVRTMPTLRRAASFVMPKAVHEHIYRKGSPLTRPSGRFTLTTQEVRTVTDMLKPDLLRLQQVYGVDIKNEWGLEL